MSSMSVQFKPLIQPNHSQKFQNLKARAYWPFWLGMRCKDGRRKEIASVFAWPELILANLTIGFFKYNIIFMYFDVA